MFSPPELAVLRVFLLDSESKMKAIKAVNAHD
jgi:glycerol-3-phosphate responsive antiterminator